MDSNTKVAVTALLEGGTIANLGPSGVRIRDAKGNPVGKLTANAFWHLRDLVKKKKSGLFVAKKSGFRALHGGAWAKKEYKRLLKLNSKTNK